jgi:ribosomal protein S21
MKDIDDMSQAELLETFKKIVSKMKTSKQIKEEQRYEEAIEKGHKKYTSEKERHVDNAPRCYYKYNKETGSRICTIDIERQNPQIFKSLNLPSCPFKNDCFTRSDCLYIAGRGVSEEDGKEIVMKNLRVTKL